MFTVRLISTLFGEIISHCVLFLTLYMQNLAYTSHEHTDFSLLYSKENFIFQP